MNRFFRSRGGKGGRDPLRIEGPILQNHERTFYPQDLWLGSVSGGNPLKKTYKFLEPTFKNLHFFKNLNPRLITSILKTLKVTNYMINLNNFSTISHFRS